MNALYPLAKRALFQLDPETAHNVALRALSVTPMPRSAPRHPVEAMGLHFPNPLGTAAGLDKNGEYIRPLSRMGFGYLEIGTVTPRPQPGNPKPRMFRLPQAEAVINRLGFNNAGADAVARRLEKTAFDGVLGINIGKNRDTKAEDAARDYCDALATLYPYASYFAVNISSPNTEGLRALQERDALNALLETVGKRRDALASQGREPPLVVKIAPDLSMAQIDAIAEVVNASVFAGLIATNTTTDHHLVSHLPQGNEKGGLSGAPLMRPSTAVLKAFRDRLDEDKALIGVGGILDAKSAGEKRAAGADLLQIYTGFIYRGPKIIKQSIKGYAKAGAR